MVKILVLCPMKPNLPERIRSRQLSLLDRLPAVNHQHIVEVIVDSRGIGDAHVQGLEQRVAHTAPIRQAMIDEHLKPEHDAVLWIDADVLHYPLDLPTKLWERSSEGRDVTAPVVLQETWGDHFYDIAGFVENGHWCRPMPPWFDQPGPRVELDGVGCVYMVPAAIYKLPGAKYREYPGFTDHKHICDAARADGRKVLAFLDIITVHAWLPSYGEAQH